MPQLPFVNLVLQHRQGDCGIAALAMLLGQTYEDVLAASITRKHPQPHVGGMYTRELQTVAKRLGTTLLLRRSWDLEEDCGLLTVELLKPKPGEFPQHLVLLKFGLVFDTDGIVWTPDVYFAQHNFRPISLLVEKDKGEETSA